VDGLGDVDDGLDFAAELVDGLACLMSATTAGAASSTVSVDIVSPSSLIEPTPAVE
jgi:hypothetical protein